METSSAILIIDDKHSNITALRSLLEKPGRTFLSAMSGEEGLKIALEYEIDLIILDVQMPGMDGFEVAQILKSHKRTKETPLIFASAEKIGKDSIMKGFDEGAVDYLPKPLDPDLTRAKVSVLLKIQQQRKELLEKNRSLAAAEQKIKMLNAKLEDNLQRLEVLNKDLESFSYSVSHDLRAPLRSIIGFSAALTEDYGATLNEGACKYIDAVHRNATRMNMLIDDLLYFSKLGLRQPKSEPINVNNLVRDIVDELNNASPHKARITVDELPATRGDHSLLRQVWVNLLSNAVKYSSKKQDPEVKVSSMISGNEVVYFVKDNGAGFNMDHVGKLFNVFQRLHKPTEFEGSGVGLALASRIIQKHNGRIWAEAKKGEGACFYFSLPLAP